MEMDEDKKLEFYYQIKGKKAPEQYYNAGISDTWVFPPIFSGRVIAKDKIEAKALIEEEYQKKFPMRVLKKDIDSNDFLLSIKDMTDNQYLKNLFEFQECEECGKKFRRIDLYNDANERYKGDGLCSWSCRDIYFERKRVEDFNNNNNNNDFYSSIPVIYKITHKPSGKVYIGQTNQSFTLRWWQHIKWGKSDCKFHKAMRETPITEWSFEVIHICNDSKELDERESFYIREFDSINNGFNSARVGDHEPDKKQATLHY